MILYEIYKNNKRTGDKKMLGTVKANSKKDALKKYFLENSIRNKKGKFLVIPFKQRAKYTIVKY